MHLDTAHMACSECLPTLLNPLAERTCFSQVYMEYAGPAPPRASPRHTSRTPQTTGVSITEVLGYVSEILTTLLILLSTSVTPTSVSEHAA
jgi:hypothetical protein